MQLSLAGAATSIIFVFVATKVLSKVLSRQKWNLWQLPPIICNTRGYSLSSFVVVVVVVVVLSLFLSRTGVNICTGFECVGYFGLLLLLFLCFCVCVGGGGGGGGRS